MSSETELPLDVPSTALLHHTTPDAEWDHEDPLPLSALLLLALVPTLPAWSQGGLSGTVAFSAGEVGATKSAPLDSQSGQIPGAIGGLLFAPGGFGSSSAGGACTPGLFNVTGIWTVTHEPSGISATVGPLLAPPTSVDVSDVFAGQTPLGPWSLEAQLVGVAPLPPTTCAFHTGVLSASLIFLETPGVTLESISGLVSNDVGDFSPVEDPRDGGRLFVDHSLDAPGQSPDFFGGDYTPNQQRTKLVVRVDPADFDPAGLTVRWEVLDPDDPATEDDFIDPSVDPALTDNTGQAHEGSIAWFLEADHPLLLSSNHSGATTTTDPLGTAVTGIEQAGPGGDWFSTVHFFASDDGGDNFLFLVSLLDASGKAIAVELTPKPVTMWRYRELWVNRMKQGLNGLMINPRGFLPASSSRVFDPLATASLLRTVFGGLGGSPDQVAYIDWSVQDRGTVPHRWVLGGGAFVDYLHRHPRTNVHGTGVYSLLGVDYITSAWIVTTPGHSNTDSYPHCMVAVGLLESALNSLFSEENARKLKRSTSAHEVGHLLAGRCEAPSCFHGRHGPGNAPCVFREGSETLTLCPLHVSMLRDRLSRPDGGAHSYCTVEYDSARSPDRNYGLCGSCGGCSCAECP